MEAGHESKDDSDSEGLGGDQSYSFPMPQETQTITCHQRMNKHWLWVAILTLGFQDSGF